MLDDADTEKILSRDYATVSRQTLNGAFRAILSCYNLTNLQSYLYSVCVYSGMTYVYRSDIILGTRKHAGVCVNKMALARCACADAAVCTAQTTHTFIAPIIKLLSYTS